MLGKFVTINLGIVLSISVAARAATGTNLSAAQIADKSVAASGGLQAWRAVQTLSEEGTLGAGGDQRSPLRVSLHTKNGSALPSTPRLAQEAQLPFVMEMQRPRKVRFELQFKGKTAIQVYNGETGWKLRPYLNREEIEPFTEDEIKAASTQSDLDGPLVDYAAKGTRIELVGIEKVEGHDAYKLKLTLKNGKDLHVWIDTSTFLETKLEGQPRVLDGKMHPVQIYFRDYRTVSGIQLPFELETRVSAVENSPQHPDETYVQAERITIAKAVVNPKLDASRFTKPVDSLAALR